MPWIEAHRKFKPCVLVLIAGERVASVAILRLQHAASATLFDHVCSTWCVRCLRLKSTKSYTKLLLSRLYIMAIMCLSVPYDCCRVEFDQACCISSHPCQLVPTTDARNWNYSTLSR